MCLFGKQIVLFCGCWTGIKGAGGRGVKGEGGVKGRGGGKLNKEGGGWVYEKKPMDFG